MTEPLVGLQDDLKVTTFGKAGSVTKSIWYASGYWLRSGCYKLFQQM
jgi:hypothetical protein